MTRMGNTRMPNRAMAWTSSPVEMAPVDTRQAPMASRAMVPRLGSASRPGSKRPATGRPAGGRRRPSAASAHAAHLPVLQAQRLDHQGAVERLVGHGGHLAQVGLARAAGASHPAAVVLVEYTERREQGQAHQHEQRVYRRQADHRQHQEPATPMVKGNGMMALIERSMSASARARSRPVGWGRSS